MDDVCEEESEVWRAEEEEVWIGRMLDMVELLRVCQWWSKGNGYVHWAVLRLTAPRRDDMLCTMMEVFSIDINAPSVFIQAI